jgi:N-methylhydantoinase B
LAAAPGRLTLIRDGIETQLRSKIGNLRLKRGDVIRLETSGGGGFGAPAERDPAAIARDVALGYVTPEAAARDYGRREIAAE